MTSYKGRHAELYDLFYASKPYREEAQFVVECFALHGLTSEPLRILEVACGTGTHVIHFAKLGCQITASDSSPGMLAVARRKAEESGVSVNFVELDMRHLPPPDIAYDSVVCLFDSIGYVQTDDALDLVFSGVRKNLRSGGLFIFEFWHAPAMLGSFDPVRVRRFPKKNGMVLRISETTLLPEQSLARVAYDIYDLNRDLSYDHLTEVHTNRFFTVSEMQAWAAKQGFTSLAYYAGFDRKAHVTDATWHVVAVWSKP